MTGKPSQVQPYPQSWPFFAAQMLTRALFAAANFLVPHFTHQVIAINKSSSHENNLVF